jgi:hypothetical protein
MRSDRSPHISPMRDHTGFRAGEPRQSCGSRWWCGWAGLVFATAVTCAAQDGRPASAPAAQPSTAPQTQTTPPAIAKPQTDPPATPQAAANDQRRKQISVDSTQLLAMAVDLKAEVDKTNKDTLSINVIRKADAIEKLAKTVKEKIKQGSGPG